MTWEKDIEKIWKPEYDYILEEIKRLYKEEQKIRTKNLNNSKKKRALKKNLELTRIYLPKEDFKFLEEYRPFKKLHNLGGIPVSLIKEEKIKIDVEIVNPRKRKRKTVIYVREEK